MTMERSPYSRRLSPDNEDARGHTGTSNPVQYLMYSTQGVIDSSHTVPYYMFVNQSASTYLCHHHDCEAWLVKHRLRQKSGPFSSPRTLMTFLLGDATKRRETLDHLIRLSWWSVFQSVTPFPMPDCDAELHDKGGMVPQVPYL
nr:hypothetical protein CFP56_63559 [Quercus suber]